MVNHRIYLGSKSPRRRELLTLLGINYNIVDASGPEEVHPQGMSPEKVPEYLSQLKSKYLLPYIDDASGILLTADTVVILDDKIIEKPHDRHEAIEMLKMLSGRTHNVITGVTIASGNKIHSFSESTKVSFCDLTDDEINYYVDTATPYDKAGAYGIQEWIGGVAVERINGCFYNVMGLPLSKLYHELNYFVTLLS